MVALGNLNCFDHIHALNIIDQDICTVKIYQNPIATVYNSYKLSTMHLKMAAMVYVVKSSGISMTTENKQKKSAPKNYDNSLLYNPKSFVYQFFIPSSIFVSIFI